MGFASWFRRRQVPNPMRQLVRDREQLAALTPGGSPAHPIAVSTAAVIEARAARMPCAQCAGDYRVLEHAAPASGLRRVVVRCARCEVPRALWFRIAPDDPN